MKSRSVWGLEFGMLGMEFGCGDQNIFVPHSEVVTCFGVPHGGAHGVRPPSIPGCFVTKYATHLALKLIARCRLTFDGRFVLHRAAESVVTGGLGVEGVVSGGWDLRFRVQG